METAALTPPRAPVRGIAATAAVTLVASVLAVLVVRAITVAMVDVPTRFQPLTVGSDVSLTVIGVLLATGAWVLVRRRVAAPVATYRRVATAALVVSFVPDIAIWAGGAYDGAASASTVLPLMVMHVIVGALCIALLPTAADQRGVGDRAPGIAPVR